MITEAFRGGRANRRRIPDKNLLTNKYLEIVCCGNEYVIDYNTDNGSTLPNIV